MYKTIVLELLQQRPLMHEQLRKDRRLLATMNQLAKQLKAAHEFWKGQLRQTLPGSDPNQIASQALEAALTELENRLPPESPPDDGLTLDAAMAYIRRHTPHA
jgi:hypothetical protein